MQGVELVLVLRLLGADPLGPLQQGVQARQCCEVRIGVAFSLNKAAILQDGYRDCDVEMFARRVSPCDAHEPRAFQAFGNMEECTQLII